MKFGVMVVVAMLSLSALACARGEIQSVERQPDGSIDVVVRYTEVDFNEMIEGALLASGNPLLRDPSVDLRSGQVHVAGEHDKRDGSGERIAGTLTGTVTVRQGALLFQIIAADIEGVAVEQAELDRINANMTASMERRASREGRIIEMLDVLITDDYVDVTFNAERRSNN